MSGHSCNITERKRAFFSCRTFARLQEGRVSEGHTDSCLPSVARNKDCRLKVPMAELQLCAAAVRL